MVHTNTSARLGEVIETSLNEAGITLRQTEERTGIARTTLSRRLRIGGWTVEEIAAVASVLGLTAAELVAKAEGVAA